MALIFTILTFLSTLAGGLVGLKYRDKLHLILGFTAGVLLGVISFDIFPEIINLVIRENVPTIHPMIALVVGFLLFHIFEKLLLIHKGDEESYVKHTHSLPWVDRGKHPTVGIASALALSGHSFLDGVGIGFGFQVSSAVGIAVAVAVVAHDFSDGLNTVSLTLLHKNSIQRTLKLLLVDAIAPVLGAVSTIFYKLPENILILYLGFFAGFLLYIGASDILPEAHHEHSSVKTLVMTVLGVVFIFVVTRFT